MTPQEFISEVTDTLDFIDPDLYATFIARLPTYVDSVCKLSEENFAALLKCLPVIHRQKTSAPTTAEETEVKMFMEIFYEEDKLCSVSVASTVQRYLGWCKLRGIRSLDPTHFGRAMSKLQFMRSRTNKHYIGIREKTGG